MNSKIKQTYQKLFAVEYMLGRPFKKYNLLISKEDGSYFSSFDSPFSRSAQEKIKKLMCEFPDGTENWDLFWTIKAKQHSILHTDDDIQFYCFLSVADFKDIEKFERASWGQSKVRSSLLDFFHQSPELITK